MLPNSRGAETDYLEWTARKRTGLRRKALDCGHPNPGEVFYHAWCDRLTCSEECANGVHECGDYAGVKSGSEEESEPVDAVAAQLEALGDYLEALPPSDTSPWVSFDSALLTTLPPERTHIAITTAYDPDGSTPIWEGFGEVRDRVGDAMRAEVLRQGLTECEIDGVRQEYRDGGWDVVDRLRSAEAEGIELGPIGRQLLAQADRLEPTGYRACMERLAPPVDAALQPDMSECRNDSDIPTRPWWRRLFPGRSTR